MMSVSLFDAEQARITMSQLVPRKCASCAGRLEKLGDTNSYWCPYCQTAYDWPQQYVRVEHQFTMPAPSPEQEFAYAKDVLESLPRLIRTSRADLAQAQLDLAQARRAQAAARDERARELKERAQYALGFGAASAVCFLIGLAARSESLALGLLIAAIAMLIAAAYNLNRLWRLGREPTPALAAASARVTDLEAQCGQLENNIAAAEQHMEVRRAEVNDYLTRIVPGMMRRPGGR